MYRISTLALLLTLPVFLMSCAEDSLPTAPGASSSAYSETGERVHSGASLDYHSVMWRSSANAIAGKHHNAVSEFATPLFKLATAPNDDILVADAGAGIATEDGRTDITLPGVTAISPIGRGSMWATTSGSDPLADTGQALYRVSRGSSQRVVNLFEVEITLNPHEAPVPDSNPYDVVGLDGNAALVVDAGGNVLYRIDARGNVEIVAVFPDEDVSTNNIKDLLGCPASGGDLCELPPQIPAQAVPTSVAIGPDGSYYVGELKGFPAPTGASNIWRISPDASSADCGISPDCEKVFEGGFTSVIDLAFGDDGTLYVVEFDELSWAAVEFGIGGAGGTINACDLNTLSCSVVAEGIPMLTAISLERDGTIRATQNALIPGEAGVIEIP